MIVAAILSNTNTNNTHKTNNSNSNTYKELLRDINDTASRYMVHVDVACSKKKDILGPHHKKQMKCI